MPQKTCTSAREYASQLAELVSSLDTEAIEALSDKLLEIWADHKRVLVFGNGGSAATASHFICDLVKTAGVPGQPKLDAVSLADNVAMMTAIGNDISYDDIFQYSLESLAHPGDLVIAISCSGNSKNVINACEWAKKNGITIAGLTGFTGGKLKEMADIHIHIPSDNFGLVEDLHLAINHMISQGLKTRIERKVLASCTC